MCVAFNEAAANDFVRSGFFCARFARVKRI